MNVDANIVIEKLLDQIREMTRAIIIKDCQIESLQKQLLEVGNEQNQIKG